MKFYDREHELAELNKLLGQAKSGARMTVLTGRRRVGKTLLSLELVARAREQKHVYFFVAKKSEALLCAEYLQEIKQLFPDAPVVGEIRSFKDIFQLLLRIAQKEHFTLIVDEFQEFYNINPAIYSEIQKLWDLNKSRCRLNVIFVGSVYSLMHKIFQNSKEPLFNRTDRILSISPFPVKTIHMILHDYKVKDPKVCSIIMFLQAGCPSILICLLRTKPFHWMASLTL